MVDGGSGLRRMTQVKLMVLPIPTNTSLPPMIVVLGSVYLNFINYFCTFLVDQANLRNASIN